MSHHFTDPAKRGYDFLTKKMCNFLCHRVVRQCGLIRIPFLLELHRTEQ